MPLTRTTSDTSTAFGQPIARSFGLAVLIALAVLVALRQIFGSIRVEAGTR